MPFNVLLLPVVCLFLTTVWSVLSLSLSLTLSDLGQPRSQMGSVRSRCEFTQCKINVIRSRGNVLNYFCCKEIKDAKDEKKNTVVCIQRIVLI